MMKIPASTVDGPLFVKLGTYDDPELIDVTVPDLEEASKVVLAYLDENDVGSRDWRGGEVVSEATRECVAVVSLNGRVWFPSSVRNPEGEALAGDLEYDLGA